MGARGRRRRRTGRRRLRWLIALTAVGGAVWAMPYLDPAVNQAMSRYGPDWRLADEPPASRSADRPELEAAFPDDAAAGQDVPDEQDAPAEQNVPAEQNAPAKPGLGRALQVGVPQAGTGQLVLVPPGPAAPVRGRLYRYLVHVEKGLPHDPREFADTIHRVLNDKRSWGRGGTMTFQQVKQGPADFRIALASPALTDKFCLESGLKTEGRVSCFARRSNAVMINAMRWSKGAAAYRGNLPSYRTYLVNHEVGHRLGRGHVGCPGAGKLAPVMVQQTKSVGACRPNPWPYP